MLSIVALIVFFHGTVALLSLEDAVKNIQSDVQKYAHDKITAGATCDLATSECPLSEMSTTESTQVFTGGATRCIYTDSTPYSFQVVRGDPTKLLFYFQGGGACWNEASTKLGLCTTDARLSALDGIFSRSAESNPDFHDYTFVQVLYCSGDAHAGNTTRTYVDPTGNPVLQVGAVNTQAVIHWLLTQGLGTFDELVLAGCSAGSVGVQVLADWVLDQIPHNRAAVVPDSFTGLFPPTSQGVVIKDFGVCDSVILDEKFEEMCLANELTMQDLVLNLLEDHPNVPVATVNSKTDIVQQSYYVAIGALNRSLDAKITPKTYYEGINEIYELYHQYPNHVAFLVSSSMHCYTNKPIFATSDTLGLVGGGGDDGAETLRDWVGALPLGTGSRSKEMAVRTRAARAGLSGGSNISWACAGNRLSLEDANATGARPHAYCDETLTDRVVVPGNAASAP